MTDNDNGNPFGEPIYSYTRAMAIADGALIDVSETAREAGFKIPVAVTEAVWVKYVTVPAGVEGQDEKGRLWDIVWMARYAASKDPTATETPVSLFVRNENNRPPKRITLKMICGPGDDAAPVITIMLPEED